MSCKNFDGGVKFNFITPGSTITSLPLTFIYFTSLSYIYFIYSTIYSISYPILLIKFITSLTLALTFSPLSPPPYSSSFSSLSLLLTPSLFSLSYLSSLTSTLISILTSPHINLLKILYLCLYPHTFPNSILHLFSHYYFYSNPHFYLHSYFQSHS